MRILHIVAGLHLGGGLASSIPLLARFQKKVGHTVSVSTLSSAFGAEMQEAQKNGVEFLAFRRSSPHFLFFSWGMLLNLHKAIKWADVVHVHALWTFPVWWGCCLACMYKKILIMSPRGTLDPMRLAHSAWKKKMVGWIDRLCCQHAAGIHVTSAEEYNWVTMYLGEKYKSKIRVIPNGLQIPKGDYKQQFPTLANKRMILSLGRLHPLKGLDLLLEAWSIVSACKQASDWKLVIVGPDEQGVKDELVGLCEKLSLKNCEFRDGIYNEQKWGLLSTADVFVFPSRSENFGNVVGEALACGVPVVMTDVGPWKAEMEKSFDAKTSDTPICFVETNASGIADGLSRVMALSDETRKEMGAAGKMWVSREFTWEKVASEMIAVYQEM